MGASSRGYAPLVPAPGAAMTETIPKTILINRTFDELELGETASLVRVVSEDDIRLFAATSGDVNPAHLDVKYAATDIFGHVVIHGMWTAGLLSTILGTQLPGPGTIYLSQDLRFRRPVAPGDTITATVTVREKSADKHIVVLDTLCHNQDGKEVLSGKATVVAPTEKLSLPRIPVPEVVLRRHNRFDQFLEQAKALPALHQIARLAYSLFPPMRKR